MNSPRTEEKAEQSDARKASYQGKLQGSQVINISLRNYYPMTEIPNESLIDLNREPYTCFSGRGLEA